MCLTETEQENSSKDRPLSTHCIINSYSKCSGSHSSNLKHNRLPQLLLVAQVTDQQPTNRAFTTQKFGPVALRGKKREGHSISRVTVQSGDLHGHPQFSKGQSHSAVGSMFCPCYKCMWDGRGKDFHYASFQDGTLVQRDSIAACMFVNELQGTSSRQHGRSCRGVRASLSKWR